MSSKECLKICNVFTKTIDADIKTLMMNFLSIIDWFLLRGGFFIISWSTASTPNDCATGPSQIISIVILGCLNEYNNKRLIFNLYYYYYYYYYT